MVINIYGNFTKRSERSDIKTHFESWNYFGRNVDLPQVFVFLIPTNLSYMESLWTHHDGWENYWGMKYKYFCQPQIIENSQGEMHICILMYADDIVLISAIKRKL